MEFNNEVWMRIKNYPLYDVSDMGRIRSWNKKGNRGKTFKFLKPYFESDGYGRVILSNSEGKEGFLVHRLVLQAFIPHCPKGMEASHLNGKQRDNRLQNLCWQLHKDNIKLRDVHGTTAVGMRHAAHKLTDDEVKYIYFSSDTMTALARQFNVTRQNIHYIKIGKIWKHLGLKK